MAEKSRRQMRELPKFATEQEEAGFWDTHDSTVNLGATEPVAATFVDVRPPKQQISLRLQVLQAALLFCRQRLFEQEIQLPCRHIGLKLLVPPLPILLGKPSAET
jgi:hypothetical protein